MDFFNRIRAPARDAQAASGEKETRYLRERF